MSNIQLHCDIKQDYNDIAQYLGAVVEIKQVGHPSYEPIVGVMKTGQLYWSTSLAWDKKYTNSMRPSYNYTRSRTGSEFSSNIVKYDPNYCFQVGTNECNFLLIMFRGCHSRDRMVVVFTTTYPIGAYHH